MVEIGDVRRGVVIRVMPYGAMVRLDCGATGLVHISEIDNRFVQDVSEYLATQMRVVVKVIQIKEGGRMEFSLKRARHAAPIEETGEEFDESLMYHAPADEARTSRAAFDDKLREFLMDSMENLSDIRRHNEHKLGLKHRK